MPDSMRRIPDGNRQSGKLPRRYAAHPRKFPCRWRQPESLPLCDEAGKPLALEDCLGATAEESDKAIDRVLLRELLASLEPRERQVILLRYFMDKTQSDVAKVLHISQVQVSRLESKILKRMRQAAET